MRLGALEAGGTKMVCSLGNENGEVLERASFPTTTPEETIPLLIGFFKDREIEALGIASFGPVDLNKTSSTYGYITTTPKLAWQHYPLLPQMKDALGVPCEMDTDVNAAAFAEATYGAAKGLSSCLYVTVGTGIGGGLVIEGNLVHGMMHPEFGHMLMRPIAEDIMPEGCCPFHVGCLEGLACGPAIEKRWGVSAKELPKDHIAWSIEAGYLAQMCANAVFCLSPEKIILGGGVMMQDHLYPMIRRETERLLGGYIQHEAVLHGMEDYIVAPGLGINSGVVGALLLARRAAEA